MAAGIIPDPATDYRQRLDSNWNWAMDEADRHFRRDNEVFKTLHKLASQLDRLGIPYAVAGSMAMFQYGFRRLTMDVDVLVNRAGLNQIHENRAGSGYVPQLTGGKNLRDAESGVRIEFLITGDYPGDGLPKPLAFPDPASAAVTLDGINYLSLPTLVELKLASGMTGGVTRLKDLADVIALIQTLDLPASFSDQLNPYVRDRYAELWTGVQNQPASEY